MWRCHKTTWGKQNSKAKKSSKVLKRELPSINRVPKNNTHSHESHRKENIIHRQLQHWVKSSFSSRNNYLWISIALELVSLWSGIHCLFRRVLLNFHVFINFLWFLLQLIFNFTAIWSDNVYVIISVSLPLLKAYSMSYYVAYFGEYPLWC